MTPLPKRKLSRARQGKRRNSIHLGAVATALCPNCNQPKLPHHICPNCGFYNGEEVIKPETKRDNKLASHK